MWRTKSAKRDKAHLQQLVRLCGPEEITLNLVTCGLPLKFSGRIAFLDHANERFISKSIQFPIRLRIFYYRKDIRNIGFPGVWQQVTPGGPTHKVSHIAAGILYVYNKNEFETTQCLKPIELIVTWKQEMKQELSLPQTSQITFAEPSAVYDTLARLMLAYGYENVFLDATGLPIQLVPGGTATWPFPFQGKGNPFCSLMAQFTGSCAVCQQAHTELQRQVADRLAPQVICCSAGLTEFAVPIVVSGQHVATLLGGQVFQRKPSQAQFARLTQRLLSWDMHQELPRFEATFFQTRVTSPKQLQASVQLLTIFAKFLAENVNRNLLAASTHDGAFINIAKNFIIDHASEPLHLSDVADHVHVSTNYFSKFFKTATGIGFSEFLARIRVEHTKDLLANPILPITEVANQAGFGSLSQFNRAFHRYVGCSPKEYRASLL